MEWLAFYAASKCAADVRSQSLCAHVLQTRSLIMSTPKIYPNPTQYDITSSFTLLTISALCIHDRIMSFADTNGPINWIGIMVWAGWCLLTYRFIGRLKRFCQT